MTFANALNSVGLSLNLTCNNPSHLWKMWLIIMIKDMYNIIKLMDNIYIKLISERDHIEKSSYDRVFSDYSIL
jgi:hypothetical protein